MSDFKKEVKNSNEEKIALASVYGTIPVIIGLILGMGVLFYYEGGWFLSVFFLFLFLIVASRTLHRAQTFKHYKEMNAIQKKPLFAVILWETVCFWTPLFFSKNGNEYVLNLFIILLISGIPFYIFYKKLGRAFINNKEVKPNHETEQP